MSSKSPFLIDDELRGRLAALHAGEAFAAAGSHSGHPSDAAMSTFRDRVAARVGLSATATNDEIFAAIDKGRAQANADRIVAEATATVKAAEDRLYRQVWGDDGTEA